MDKSNANIQLENSLNELMAIVERNNRETQKMVRATAQAQKTLLYRWKRRLKAFS